MLRIEDVLHEEGVALDTGNRRQVGSFKGAGGIWTTMAYPLKCGFLRTL